LKAIDLCPFLYDRSNAVDFHERLAWQTSNGNSGASRTAIRKVCLEDGVHSVVIVQLRQVHGELKNAVHSAAACFNGGFYAIHHHFRSEEHTSELQSR